MDNQVCMIEQSKKLLELGVDQKSEFFHTKSALGDAIVDKRLASNYHYRIPAFTVSELGIMLPAKSWSYRTEGGFWICKTCGTKSTPMLANTEAEARAIKLIHLIETGSITVQEVNERLEGVTV